MRAADGFGGLVHGGVETKGLRHEIDVVVDGLGDADDGNADVALAYFLGDGGGGLHGAVAADDEEDAHVEPFERIDDFGRFLRPPGGAEERSAELVNMLDAGWRQLHYVVAVGGDETFEPVTDAQNGRRVVGVVGFKDNGPDHVVEAGAKAAAGDDGAFGFAGIEIQILTRPRFFKKQGLMGNRVLIVFVAQAQHHLSGIDHVPVRKRRGDFGLAERGDGDFADRDAVFRCHGYSPDGFFSRCWRAKQLVRMPPPRHIERIECPQHGDVQEMVAAFGNLRAYAVFFIAEDEQGGGMQAGGEGVEAAFAERGPVDEESRVPCLVQRPGRCS